MRGAELHRSPSEGGLRSHALAPDATRAAGRAGGLDAELELRGTSTAEPSEHCSSWQPAECRSRSLGMKPGHPWDHTLMGSHPESPKAQWSFPSSDSEAQSAATGASPGGRSSRSSSDAARRRSSESTSSSRSETGCKPELLEGLHAHDSMALADSLLSRSMDGRLGISARKSLLCSMVEAEAAHEAAALGPAGGLPGFPGRRCVSFADVSLFAAAALAAEGHASDAEDCGELAACLSGSLSRQCSNGSVVRQHSGGGWPLGDSPAAAELFLRLNHARQTVSFVRNQAARFSALDRGEMGLWEALGRLGELREYETALLRQPGTDPGMPLLEHALQTAEACRLAHPTADWLHLAGLIHSLGKLLGHAEIAGEPQWAICGESFPVGCRFDPAVTAAQFFSVNPDRRCRAYSAPAGIYRPGCGLAAVYMSWSAAEYLYMLLLLNRTRLPPEALFVIRYHKFRALEHSPAYRSLMSAADARNLPWLAEFRRLSAYKRVPLEGALQGAALREYYDGLIRKYIPGGALRF